MEKNLCVDAKAVSPSALSPVEYRVALTTISDELGSDDLENIKYLCLDILPFSKSKNVKEGFELFTLLETNAVINEGDLNLIRELLYRIGRLDLIKRCNLPLSLKEPTSSPYMGKISPHRILLYEIAEDLLCAELETMKFVADAYVLKSKLSRVKTPFDLFNLLEQNNDLSPGNYDALENLLSSARRQDLIKKIHQTVSFLKNKSFSTVNNSLQKQSMILSSDKCNEEMESENNTFRISSFPPENNWKLSTEFVQNHNSMNDDQSSVNRIGELSNSSYYRSSAVDRPSYDSASAVSDLDLPASVSGVTFDDSDSELEDDCQLASYKMTARPLGVCIVINNMQFHHISKDPESRKFPNRIGSDIDADMLTTVFKKLGFIIKHVKNLSKSDMERYLTMCAQRVDHSHFDAFICCILSHGTRGQVYGVDGKPSPISTLTSYFKATSCHSLAGKPKLFFIQACQGTEKQPGQPPADLEADGPEEIESPPETIPNEADFLLSYATLPGFVSYRSQSQGSWFITRLCSALEKYTPRYDLMSIMVKVNEEVSKASAQTEGEGPFKQIPAPIPTLRKRIFFGNASPD